MGRAVRLAGFPGLNFRREVVTVLPVPQPALGTRPAPGPCKQRPRVSRRVNCKELNTCTLTHQLLPASWTEGQIWRHEIGFQWQAEWAGPRKAVQFVPGTKTPCSAVIRLLVRVQPEGGAIPVLEARTIMATVDTARNTAMTTRAQRRDFMYIGSPGVGGTTRRGRLQPLTYISIIPLCAPTASAQTPG